MSTGKSKLMKDLDIVEAMELELDAYLINDTLFRQMSIGMPKLTLGGFFLRTHRLATLSDVLLDQPTQTKVTGILEKATATINKRHHQFMQRLQQEAQARQRQWRTYLTDLDQEKELRELNSYRTAVESRIMLVALKHQAEQHSSSLGKDLDKKIEQDDAMLRRHWQPRKFIWAEEWQPAYPEETFWWLYGRPKV